jgi:dihydroorotate dehydrogenase
LAIYDLVTPLLYRMDPERAHSLGVFFMKFLRGLEVEDNTLKVKTAFGELRNPLGLAAGFDKAGAHLGTIQKLGFGYLVAGTITLDPWPGHPKPRIVRNISEKSLLNCLGFPNPGADDFVKKLARQKLKVPVIASISGKTEESILVCYEKVQPHVSAIELNLSSPNTQKLKDLRDREALVSLSRRMFSVKEKPTYLKVPPFSEEAQSKKSLEMINIWSDAGFEGVTASNTMTVKDARLSMGTCGYSGPPLFKFTLNAIREIRRNVSSNFEINGVGGISTARDVREALDAGANTVQLMTALVYDGPALIKKMLTDLLGEPAKTSIPQHVKKT